MKIAIEARPIVWSYGTGIGNYTYCLIEKLAEIDPINQYTFLWADTDPRPLIPFNRPYTHYVLPKDDQREADEIPYWLQSEGADLFHLPQNGFRTPKNTDCQIIVTIHDLIPYILPEVVRTSFLRRFITEMPFILERAAKIITVSESSKQDIIRIFKTDPAKIAVIPSAPANYFKPLPKPETVKYLKEHYGLRKEFILYVGGLNQRKNVAELIYAYSKIYRDLPNGEPLIILGGESKNRQKLMLLTESLDLKDQVLFPGFVKNSDLPWFYNGAALFVYPSLYEGFGLPPIEAMACDTPVITSNLSSLPEIVGDAAIQVNPYDTLALAQAMFTVLSDEPTRAGLITKGRERSQLYQWPRIAAAVLNVYHQVVTGGLVPKVAAQ